MKRVYLFSERMAMSTGVATAQSVGDVLTGAIPGATAVRRASERDDRNGTDWWVDREHGRPLSVDVKVREQDWAATHPDEDDLALEVWSKIEQKVIGWTLNSAKATDYVLWWWSDTGRWCLVPFPMLVAVFQENYLAWTTTYRKADQSTEEQYHSRCVFVPRRIVWRAIYERFGGLREAA
jgi:hypothetical protein